MIAGFFTIIIEVSITFGGWDPIHEAAKVGGIYVNDFRPDPTLRFLYSKYLTISDYLLVAKLTKNNIRTSFKNVI